MSNRMRFLLQRYGVAVIAVAIALLLKLLLKPLIGTETPFLLFFGAVMIAAYYGGMGSGLLATALAALVSDYFFLSPTHSLLRDNLRQNLQLGIFVLECLSMTSLIAALYTAKQQAERSKLESQHNFEQLEVERARLEAVVRQIPAGLIIAEASSGKIILANEQVEQIWRHPLLPSEDIEQYREWRGFHPDGQTYQPEEWPLARSINTGEVVTGEEIDFLRGDGTYGTMSVSSAPIRNQSGHIVAGVVTFSDVTDRKQNEKALQESYSILRAVIEGTTDAVFMKDLQGRYVVLNWATANVIGKPVEDIVGKDDTEIFPSNIASQVIETDRRVITSEVAEYSEEIIPVRGDLRTFFSSKTVCRNEQGKVIGLVGVARDITDRKRAEQQIKELNQDLERRVVERTAQLEAAKKELEAFSYSVSHDLRAPLRSIDGFSLALLERYAEHLDEKGKYYLQRVRAASQRMGQLIDDLLKLSRVTRSEMQRQTVDLSALVQAIALELQQTQPERSVEFVIAPGVLAQGDPRLLRVALENLLNNAWKFTSKQVYPRIEFGTLPQSDDTIAYFVRDNGAGFDMAYANKLFGAFQRLHTEHEFPGTGIGLATVQRIIHRHGGRVWAEGAVEQGATFYFTFNP